MESAPWSLSCFPEGRLGLSGTPDDAAVAAAFAESDAAGMLALAVREEAFSDAGLEWLRRFARRWLARVCQTRAPEPPVPPDDVADHAHAVPPFPGAEYVDAALLERLWREAGAHLAHTAAHDPGGLEGWLHTHAPAWKLVGRVTFHLAENKRDAEKPFAFLATYAEAVTTGGQLQHRPLGRALQAYAAQQDRQTLETLLSPVRAAADACAWVRERLEDRSLFQALRWGPSEAYRFIRDLPVLQAAGLVAKVPDWWKGGRPARPMATVKIDADKAMLGIGAMLSFRVETTLDGEPLTEADWQRIHAAPAGLVNLRGQWIEIDRARLDQVMDHWHKVAAAHAAGGLSFHEGMRFLAGFHERPAGAEEEGDPNAAVAWSEVVAGKNLQTVLERLRDPGVLDPPPAVKATLRPYQEKGVAWLRFLRSLGLGACLADDMGLGKTLQVIALLTLEKSAAPALLVVPASLLGNWRAEFATFAPQLRVFFLHASQTPRDVISEALAAPAKAFAGYDAVVTTYAAVARTPALAEMEWAAVVLDEAQAIKNAGAAQARAAKKLRARWRLALTGTPVENRPGDLWSLFDFLNPGLLGGAAAFSQLLKRLTDGPAAPGYAPLRRLVQPYLLRRLKTDRTIISDLPDKTEVLARCGLSRRQTIIYGRLVEQLKKDLHDDTLSPMERRGLVVSYLVKFKQVCNHPSHWSGDGVFAPEDSGKFQRLAEVCAAIADRQERVLVFTQFREIIEPLAEFLTGLFRRPGLSLHGGTPVGRRQELVRQFQEPGGPPFFLLSVKAGGAGLTLTAASHVIHFDRWWNPAVENQATDRAYRIGQHRNVLVHKFLCAGTIEERIETMIEEKKALAADLLGADDPGGRLLTEMSNEELLRFVALDAAAATLA